MRLLSSGVTGAAVVSSILAGSFLNPVVTGGTTATAGTDYLAISSAFALVALFFGLIRVAMMKNSLPRRALDAVPNGVKVKGRQVGTIAFASLLVSAAVATTPAAAETTQCTDVDALIYDMVTVGGFIENPDHPCSTQYQVNQAVTDMKESDANQTKVDIYEAALAQRSQVEVTNTNTENYLNDSQSVAWMHAQVAVAEAYQNGSSAAVARSKARQAVADYYANKQKNLIESWNVTASTFIYLHNTAEMEDNMSGSYVHYDDSGNYIGYVAGNDTKTYSLVDGSNASVYAVRVNRDYDGSDTMDHFGTMSYTAFEGNATYTDTNGATYTIEGMVVDAPDENYNQLNYVHFENYEARWNRIETLNTNLQSETDNFVNATYADFESGEINATDVISANTAMFMYGTETGDNSSLYSSTAALSLMGFDTPTMDSSGLMDVTYQGNTYQGLVLARNAPGDQWEAGTTYNTSNISGPVFMATTDGQKVEFADGELFTIDNMTAKDGTEIQTQNTTTYVYKTANTSELLEMQQQLTELREEIESREAQAGSTTTDGRISLKTEDKAIIAGAVVALILVARG